MLVVNSATKARQRSHARGNRSHWKRATV